MELELKREKNVSVIDGANKFIFYKNIIKKDLEVASWCNKASNVFGSVEVYSDRRAELDSFDYIVSSLTGRAIAIDDDTLESYVSSKCTEYFLTILVHPNINLKAKHIDALATQFTNYILEATVFIVEKPRI